MIDTLRLCLNSFTVKSTHQLKIVPASDRWNGYNLRDQDLWKDETDTIATGTYATWTDGIVNVTIKSVRPNLRGRGFIKCWVSLSMPKFVSQTHNFWAIDGKTAYKVIQAVGQILSDIGIETDIGQAIVSRLDLFENIELDLPLIAYMPLLRSFSPSRMALAPYKTGVRYGNKQHQWCIYDKNAEMKRHKIDVRSLPRNTLRIEYRLMKAGKIQEMLRAKTINELLKHYEDLSKLYKKMLRKHLFKIEIPNDLGNMSAAKEVGIVQMQIRNAEFVHGTHAFERLFIAKAVDALTRENGGHDITPLIDSEFHSSAATKDRIKKKIRLAKMDAAILASTPLYQELRAKALAERTASRP